MSMAVQPHSSNYGAVVAAGGPNNYAVTQYDESAQRPRTSNLLAPIMLLSGHEGEIYSSKFHPEGNILASAGHERMIYFWMVFGECENFHLIKGGHNGSILDLQFNTDGSNIFTASTDKTVGMFDTETGERIKRMKGHNAIVNACSSTKRGDQLVASASDDCTVKIWDTRYRGAIKTLQLNYQVTSVCFDDTGGNVILGGIDNDVKVYDIRTGKMTFQLCGHADTITGISVNHDGSYALSNSMDCTMRVWDIRPYAPQERCIKVFTGHQHNFEKNLLKCSWSPDDSKVTGGSADRNVVVWDVPNQHVLYKLPGHNGSVNDVQFHPNQPILLSCSSDKQIYLGELSK
uniref:U5 small nuclear ribonucleoprotein 40 kDa protein n=1 Tax=Phallusia mammillata TaxID=59560 RepID=A0A6F9DSK8_9ASCI|nr:U5 small nuclear ribonucleoprotein 40 kDa protein-like [Phallusia mammillata]